MVPAAASQQGTTRHIAKNHMHLRRLEPLPENCAVLCLNAQKKRTSKDVLFFMPDTAERRQICPDPDGLCPSSALRDTAFPPMSSLSKRRPAASDQTAAPPVTAIVQNKSFWKGWGDARGEGRTFFQKGFPSPPANKQQTPPAYTLKKRSRSALLTTEKDDKAMAVPAIMGESMGPPKTCSSPAATGRPSRL